MMNEVNFFNGIRYNYTEEQLFIKLCNMYNNSPIKNISSLWFHTYYTFMNCLKENLEDAYNENGNNREELENYIFFRRSINDTNLLIIKIMHLIFIIVMNINLIMMNMMNFLTMNLKITFMNWYLFQP